MATGDLLGLRTSNWDGLRVRTTFEFDLRDETRPECPSATTGAVGCHRNEACSPPQARQCRVAGLE